jgi:hypothetical protein
MCLIFVTQQITYLTNLQFTQRRTSDPKLKWVPVTTVGRVLGLGMEETRYGGQLRIYRVNSCGHPTRGGAPARRVGGGGG